MIVRLFRVNFWGHLIGVQAYKSIYCRITVFEYSIQYSFKVSRNPSNTAHDRASFPFTMVERPSYLFNLLNIQCNGWHRLIVCRYNVKLSKKKTAKMTTIVINVIH